MKKKNNKRGRVAILTIVALLMAIFSVVHLFVSVDYRQTVYESYRYEEAKEKIDNIENNGSLLQRHIHHIETSSEWGTILIIIEIAVPAVIGFGLLYLIYISKRKTRRR